MLFGKVVGVLDEPGLHFLLVDASGPRRCSCNWLGKRYVLDMRLDQEYLRSQPVNSEEGAPMGIGVWYEMFIRDPVAYLFKNADPRGSLRANVSATRPCAACRNMKLARHAREPPQHEPDGARRRSRRKSHEWGYKLGSVYIRKVHFRDAEMIRQIEEKVVNRLRQVTSRDQAGRRQPGEHHHQHAPSGRRRSSSRGPRRCARRSSAPRCERSREAKIDRRRDVRGARAGIALESNARLTILPKGAGFLGAQLASQLPAPRTPK